MILAANWKMHKTDDEAEAWAREVRNSPLADRAEIVVLPGFVQIGAVVRALEGSLVAVGAQDVFWEERGAYTGMVSAAQLRDAGCRYALVAHSERRRYAGEDDRRAQRRIRAALAHGLTSIYCVGEDLDERDAGSFREALRAQYEVGLSGLAPEEVRRVVIAYEPVWAIGSGRPATPDQAAEVAASIRGGVAELTGARDGIRVLYGGSVSKENVEGYLRADGIDGLLVGSASLDADDFLALLKAVVMSG